MKYQRSDSFIADFGRLRLEERNRFLASVRQRNEAYRNRGGRSLPQWPASLRVKSVQRHPGIWEMTWLFTGPDGHATFEIVDVGGEPAIHWRRIGNHRIFQEP